MARKGAFRRQQLEEKILTLINTHLRQGCGDDRLRAASVSKVELNPDSSQAKVYWDTYSPEKREEIAQGFSQVRGKIRAYLASVLNIRHVPDLHFFYDSQYEDEAKIVTLLKADDPSALSGDEEEGEKDE